ncbi:unnamed protein product [Peniophora sp. CBMAI 1063]|nr:unnamed protein product [Peniophora sp. CBMAI 1063]
MIQLTPEQQARVKDATRQILPDCVSFLQQLVRIDTTNPPGTNYPECAHLFGDTIAGLGYDVEYYEVPTDRLPILAPGGQGLPRVNVLGRQEFGGGNVKVLHFNGHYDVAPAADPSAWTTPPFDAGVTGEGNDRRLVGRGASDMKGGIAAQVFAIEALKRAGLTLKGTVEHSAVVDEETTGNRNAGLGYLVELGVISNQKQTAVVITEPLNTTNVCLGHRGAVWGRFTFHGVEAHSSTPQRGKNALVMAARFIAKADEVIGELLKDRIDPNVIPPEAQAASLAFTIFDCGSATNVIPARATVTFDRRLIPSESLDAARQELYDVLNGMFEADEWDYEETYATDAIWVADDTEIVNMWKQAVKDATGVNAGIVSSPGTDDQRFVVRNANLEQCIVYGPGNIRNVHNVNESILLEDLRTGMEVMALGAAMYLGFEDSQVAQ